MADVRDDRITELREYFDSAQATRLAEALAARDRQALGLNAPPHGLYFVEARYD